MLIRPIVAATCLILPFATAEAQLACEGLVGMTLPAATVTAAAAVPAGTFTSPAQPGQEAIGPLALPPYCRVQGVARPTGDSEIKFELWLPAAPSWNGKFEQIGNGGFAGVIIPGVLAAGVARGSATAATDNGHVGGDARFALGHPEKVVDFGHRAVHLTAVHAKAIAEAFYGKSPSYTYFFGCSDGGREALMEAQRYPEDFHGILVGAPANDWTRLLTAGVWNHLAQRETPGSAIPPAKLAAIQAAVVAACDSLDGVKDGLLEDPRRCHFKPATLLCPAADAATCLTQAQVTALEKIYGGPKRPGTSEPLFGGAVAGTEAVPGNWSPWMVSGSATGLPIQAWFGTSFYSNMVFENPTWDAGTMDFERDFLLAMKKSAPALDASDSDLGPFRARGGKLIQYHGWGDAAIPAPGSIDYYQRVIAKLGGPVDDFYRLFMVPGMGHCAGGMGPNDFGNRAIAGPSRADPEHDIHLALERWVEKGVAPERIIADGVRPGEGASPPVKFARPLCAYPKTARYQGRGSSDQAESFGCAEGNR